MKLGASLLITITSAQYEDDYGNNGLDGALVYDDAARLRPNKDDDGDSGLDLNMLNSLLSSYGFDYGSNSYEYNYNDAIAADAAATTEAPGTLNANDFLTTIPFDDSGRPGADDSAGKTFENFNENQGQDQHVSNLLANEQTFCWSCMGSGVDPLTDCVNSGGPQNCLASGETDYCRVTLRRTNGVVTALESGCAQADTCAGIHNMHDAANGPHPTDQCKPNTWDGRAWATRGRNKYQESVCSICHYTQNGWGNPYPDDPTGVETIVAQANRLRINGGAVSVVSGAGTEIVLTNDLNDNPAEWGTTANNVLDIVTTI